MTSSGTSRRTTKVHQTKIPKGTTARTDSGSAVAQMLKLNLEPLEPFQNAKAKWRCKCLCCGEEVTPTLSKAKRGFRSCTTCQYAEQGDKRRSSTHTVTTLLKKHGLVALEPYKTAVSLLGVRCLACGANLRIKTNTLQQGKCLGCKECSRRSQSLSHATVEAGFRNSELELLEPYSGRTGDLLLCRCTRCDTVLYNSYKTLKQFGTRRCPTCGHTGGLRASDPAVLYLIRNKKLNALKVGIAKPESGRLKHHERNGWEIIDVVQMSTVALARNVEKEMLRGWRTAGFKPAVPKEKMPIGGSTETVSVSDVSLRKARSELRAAVDSSTPTGGR